MKINLAYGKTGLAIDLNDDYDITIVEPRFESGLVEPPLEINRVLQHPIKFEPLSDWIDSRHTVGVVVNDITRATPYRIILPLLLDRLSHLPDSQVVLFNATGTHRKNTPEELAEMYGEEICDRYKIVQNDAMADDEHRSIAITRSGNEIKVNKAFIECDRKILTGFIEPHLFAGFSGGGKAVMPGLAHIDTIMHHHSPLFLDHEMATWGVTRGNPLWEEIYEAAGFLEPMFLLNVALNREKQITEVFAGDLTEAHRQGCRYVRKHAMVPVGAPFDIVISTNSGHPLDLNLYQSVKGMSAARQILKKKGSLVMAADCYDGIPEHGSYGSLLSEAKTPAELIRKIQKKGYRMQDMWQAYIHAKICRDVDVHFYTRELSSDQLRSAFLTPCENIEATVDRLVRKHSGNARICVLPEGPQTIAYVDN